MLRRAAMVGVMSLALVACGRLQFERVPPATTDGATADAATSEAGVDAGMDAGMVEAGVDAGVDTGMIDAGVDAGIDAGVDAGVDAGMIDAGFDAGVDAMIPAPDVDYCNEVPPLHRDVVIDGVLEPGLRLRAIDPVGWTAAGVPTVTSRFAVGWQADGLYFYVEVTDDSRVPAAIDDAVWIGDGVELYADADGVFAAPPAYDNPGTTQLVAVAPGDDTTSVTRGERYRDMGLLGPWTSSTYRAFPTPTGYVVEALVQAADLDLSDWQLIAGARVGLNVSVNVSIDSAAFEPDGGAVFPRLGQYFLRTSVEPHVCAGGPFCQVLAYCTPELLE